MQTIIKSLVARVGAAHAVQIASAITVAVALGACGGSAGESDVQAASNTAPDALFDQSGRALLNTASMVPTETAARTRSGLYASKAQLAWEELVYSPVTVVVDVDRHGAAEAIAQAKAIEARRAAQVSLAYFVRAARAEDVATVANALADAGVKNVFAVTR